MISSRIGTALKEDQPTPMGKPAEEFIGVDAAYASLRRTLGRLTDAGASAPSGLSD